MKRMLSDYISACESILPSRELAQRTLEKIAQTEECTAAAKIVRRRGVAACAAVIVLIVLFTGTVYAVDHIRSLRLSDSAEFSQSTDEYAEQVCISVEHEGVCVTLGEVLYEHDKLYLIFSLLSEEDVSYFSGVPGTGLLIDGKPADALWISVCSADGGYICEYSVGDLSGEHEFELEFDSMELMFEDGTQKQIYGPWRYSLTINADTMDEQTVEFEIGQSVQLDNGDIVLLDKIVCTPFSQRLWYTIIPAQNNIFSSYRVSASDESGRCEFVPSSIHNYDGESVNISPDNFPTDAPSVTLKVVIFDRYDNILARDVCVVAVR